MEAYAELAAGCLQVDQPLAEAFDQAWVGSNYLKQFTLFQIGFLDGTFSSKYFVSEKSLLQVFTEGWSASVDQMLCTIFDQAVFDTA